MPKVTLTTRQRRANALAGLIIGSMREYGVTHAALASMLHWSDAEFFKIFKKEE